MLFKLFIINLSVISYFQVFLPASNPFQTTLLMRKVQLIWKFSPDEQSDLIDMKSENAKEFVTTEVLDTVALEKEGNISLALKLTVSN